MQGVRELGLENAFVAVYAGIHGVAQGLETLVEAARLLQEQPEVAILLIGDGPEKGKIRALAERYNSPGLRMLDEKPRSQIPAYLSAADVSLIPLKNIELFKGVLPSKLFDAWACERPVISSVDGEARRILEAAQGGWFIPPENPAALANTLKQIRSQPEICRQYGKNGRQFTLEQYSRKVQAENLAAHLENICSSSKIR